MLPLSLSVPLSIFLSLLSQPAFTYISLSFFFTLLLYLFEPYVFTYSSVAWPFSSKVQQNCPSKMSISLSNLLRSSKFDFIMFASVIPITCILHSRSLFLISIGPFVVYDKLGKSYPISLSDRSSSGYLFQCLFSFLPFCAWHIFKLKSSNYPILFSVANKRFFWQFNSVLCILTLCFAQFLSSFKAFWKASILPHNSTFYCYTCLVITLYSILFQVLQTSVHILFIQFESWLLQLLKLKIWPTYCLYVTFVDVFFVDHWARILFCKLFGVSYVWYIEHFCLSLSVFLGFVLCPQNGF